MRRDVKLSVRRWPGSWRPGLLLKFYKDNVDPANMTSLKKPTTEHEPVMKFKSADETKLVDFVPGDSSKQFSISANLDPK